MSLQPETEPLREIEEVLGLNKGLQVAGFLTFDLSHTEWARLSHVYVFPDRPEYNPEGLNNHLHRIKMQLEKVDLGGQVIQAKIEFGRMVTPRIVLDLPHGPRQLHGVFVVLVPDDQIARMALDERVDRRKGVLSLWHTIPSSLLPSPQKAA